MRTFFEGKTKYPEEGMWLEYNKKQNVGDQETHEGAVPFNFSYITNRQERVLKDRGFTREENQIIIVTNVELPFKWKDKVKIGTKTWKIVAVNKAPKENYNAKILFPGGEYFERVITLE